jgi:hypothetical protein
MSIIIVADINHRKQQLPLIVLRQNHQDETVIVPAGDPHFRRHLKRVVSSER